MLITGAGGFAIQVTDVLIQLELGGSIVFYDNTDENYITFLNNFPILKSMDAVKTYFKNETNEFIIGVGKPRLRKQLYEEFNNCGGRAYTLISPQATIGKLNVEIGQGCTILSNVIVESTAQLGIGCLINVNSVITHNTLIGDFCEICPGVTICGGAEIDSDTYVGTGAIILPKVKIGKNVIIGAGAVVNKNVPDNAKVVGVPIKFI